MTGDSSHRPTPASETDVPESATVHRCQYCDRPFRREDQRTLHVGLEHYDRMTDAEEAAFRESYEAESDRLGLYRLKLAGALVVLYFGLLLLYAVVT